MEGEMNAAGEWFEAAQREVGKLGPPQEYGDDTAHAISEAAARVVSRNGAAALTHRAVAAEAGLTLGVVSYKFRTSGHLLQAAFDAIYRRLLAAPARLEGTAVTNGEQALCFIRAGFTDRTDLLPIDEMMLASARDPELQTFAVPFRYLRGRGWCRTLPMLVGPERKISPIDGAIMSGLHAARSRARLVVDDRSPPAEPDHGFEPLLSRLGLSGT